MSEFDELHEHLKECVDSDYHTGITEDGVEFNIFEWAFGLSVKAKREHDNLVELTTKHATRADELYEALEMCIEALERSYDATEWPADGSSQQKVTAAQCREVLDRAKIDTISNSNDD